MKSVAIVGVGCRFPGGAAGPRAFWRLLRRGGDVIGEVPEERWRASDFHHEDPAAPGKMRVQWGGFLDRVDEFDPYFFGISPREAAYMDPQQRILLEVAWEALEDGGQVVEGLAGTPVGVFVGISSYDYGGMQLGDPASIADGYVNTGSALSIAANRLSYLFDFKGPSLAVDTACSSSLVAVHLACCSLESGESSLALAGGVNLILSPAVNIGFDKLNAMAADGRCKSFDARADGYVRSEGAGVVVLKPLARAVADGDPIYAVIRGSASNQDGRTNGLTAPNGPSQEELVRAALADAEVEAARIGYVEAHGTGTPLGDPIELNALGAVLARGRPPGQRCAVGSVKSNCGHLEAAAGIAGLIKVALSLRHGEVPPSLHFERPNPHIPFDELPLRVQDRLAPWPRDGDEPALAGVSSFGFGGTNAHVVVAPPPRDAERPAAGRETASGRAFLVPLSAAAPEALTALAHSYLELLEPEGEPARLPALRDLAYTACLRRSHHAHRLAAVATTPGELAERLRGHLEAAADGPEAGAANAGWRPRTVFVFPGQGSQWVGMGRELMRREPVFRAALERFDDAMREFATWSLLDEIDATEEASRLDRVDVVQPMICAIQIGLAALWRSWGIEPDAVVGQSLGEVAASHVAGALGIEDAARVICLRSRLVKSASGKGAMAVVDLALDEARRLVAGREDRVSVAVSNSPTSTVLSGDPGEIASILAELEAREVFCRLINVDYASHGPQMEPVCEELLPLLEPLRPREPSLPFYSTVASVVGHLRGEPLLDADYWARNLKEPSLFSTAVERLLADEHDIFLEISPHPILLPAIQQGVHHAGAAATLLGSLRRDHDERASLLETLGALYELGLTPAWRSLFAEPGRCVDLPGYPWQRERFWRRPAAGSPRFAGPAAPGGGAPSSPEHALLDRRLRPAARRGLEYWELEVGIDRLPYLDDHRVRGATVVPAAFFLELVRAAGERTLGGDALAIEDAEFRQALFVSDDERRTLQLALTSALPGEASFELHGVAPGTDGAPAAATLHVAGRLVAGRAEPETAPAGLEPTAAVRQRCGRAISAAEHYAWAARLGLQYGPAFQGVSDVWAGAGEALGRLRLPPALRPEADRYGVHPALLDAALQVLAQALPADHEAEDGDGGLYLPVSVARFRLLRRPRPDAELWAHARLGEETAAGDDVFAGDIVLRDEEGAPLAVVEGLRVERLRGETAGAQKEDLERWLYAVDWPAAEPAAAAAGSEAASWLVFADDRGVGRSLVSRLAERGASCASVVRGEGFRRRNESAWEIDPESPEAYERVLREAFAGEAAARHGIVHLWSLDATAAEDLDPAALEAAQRLGCHSLLRLVQALARGPWRRPPRLRVVTSAAQAVAAEETATAVAQAPVWGLGRTILLEHPELDCRLVDLGPDCAPEEVAALCDELAAEEREPQVALRGRRRHVARLARHVRAPRSGSETAGDRQPAQTSGRFRLEIAAPGVLDRLAVTALDPAPPGPGEVAIRVAAAGLNFRDVLLAMGLLDPPPGGRVALGFECAGTVEAVGEGVDEPRVGDEVLAVAPHSLSSHVVAAASCVVPRPPRLTAEEAATLPVAFLTAHYALRHLGRLAAGERVLIHTASGGVGLAAIQVARTIGAEIYATAGSEEKRDFLTARGVEHVADSRSLDFADRVMEWTAGEGVDVVLNTLAGEAIDRGLSILRSGGRFVELGKRDLEEGRPLDLRLLDNNVSFSTLDLNRLYRERPAHLATMLRETLDDFEGSRLEPLPLRILPLDEAIEAFHTMAQARHVGKIVLSVPERAAVTSAPGAAALAGGSYLITGGTGGLGLTVARSLVAQGARRLVLLSRRGPSAAAASALETLRAGGARVEVAAADVGREEELARVLADLEAGGPPLRGVIHAAGILDDGVLLNLDPGRFRSVMAPKVEGAWNLHALTASRKLDFFVLFSSAASLLGSPGQANYAAANAFLDALAHHRRARGLPAVSINWGPWSEVGLAARPDRGGRLDPLGMGSLSPAQGVAVLAGLLSDGSPQVGVLPVRPGNWRRLYEWAGELPLVAALARDDAPGAPAPTPEAAAGADDLTTAIRSAEPAARRQLVETYLRQQVARVLRIPLEKLDRRQPLNRMGIDSLMAVELKNRIEEGLEVAVPLIQFIKGPSVAQIATHLLQEMGVEEETAEPPVAASADEEAAAPPRDSLLLSLLAISDPQEDATPPADGRNRRDAGPAGEEPDA